MEPIKPIDPHTPEERADWLMWHFKRGWPGWKSDRQFLIDHIREYGEEQVEKHRRGGVERPKAPCRDDIGVRAARLLNELADKGYLKNPNWFVGENERQNIADIVNWHIAGAMENK